MSNYKGTDEFFPLKDIRVRGDFQMTATRLTKNIRDLQKEMLKLREEFGVRTYDRLGNKIFLDLWQVGRQQSNTAAQLRWRITVGETRKKIYATTSLYEIIQGKKNNHENIVKVLQSVVHLPVYQEIIATEIKRVQINMRNKASLKLLQNINDISNSFRIEELFEPIVDSNVGSGHPLYP